MGDFDVNADALFADLLMAGLQLDNLSIGALNQDVPSFVEKKSEQATGQLGRAAGLSSTSGAAINVLNCVAKAFVALGDASQYSVATCARH